MSDQQRICLEGDLARELKGKKPGDKLSLKLRGVVAACGIREKAESQGSDEEGYPDGEDISPGQPYIEILITALNDKPAYDDMSPEEMEQEIAATYNGDDDALRSVPSRKAVKEVAR